MKYLRLSAVFLLATVSLAHAQGYDLTNSTVTVGGSPVTLGAELTALANGSFTTITNSGNETVAGTSTVGTGLTNSLLLEGGANFAAAVAQGSGNPTLFMQTSGSGTVAATNANGRIVDFIGTQASLVNHVSIQGAASGSSPSIVVTNSSDANTTLRIIPKGTGAVELDGSTYINAGSKSYTGSPTCATLLLCSNGNVTGVQTGGIAAGNYLVINSDTADISAIGNTLDGLRVSHNFGGVGTKGARTAINAALTQTATNSDGGGGNIAVWATMTTNVNNGGSSANGYSGGFWGFNTITSLGPSATYEAQMIGYEADMIAAAGSSVADRVGVAVNSSGTADAVQGTQEDTAFQVGQNPSNTYPGWLNGLLFNGAFPLDNNNGAVLSVAAQTAWYPNGLLPPTTQTKANKTQRGIDLSIVEFLKYGLEVPGFAVDNTGAIQLGSGTLVANSTGMSIDTPNYQVTTAAVNGASSGNGCFVGDKLYGNYRGIYNVSAVASPGGAATALTPTPDFGDVASAAQSNPVSLTGNSCRNVSVNLTWTKGTTLSLEPSGGATTIGGNMTIGGAGQLTVGSGGVTAPSGTALIIAGGGASTTTQIKAGPNSAGVELLEISGGALGISPEININLPPGTWGSGALINNVAPINQNATYNGSISNPQASFGAFLQQTDTGTIDSGLAPGTGLTENLIINGAAAVGWRGAGMFQLSIVAPTANTTGQDYTSLTGKCTLAANDASGTSTCFALNSVAVVTGGITSSGVTGYEADTGEGVGSVIQYRIGEQIVDLATIATSSTTGVQGSIDDVALSLNNQYAPSATAGFLNGLEFGRYGGNFPLATNGTMISAQAAHGTAFTVANGIDWHLGTATGNWLNLGGVFTVAGSGNITLGNGGSAANVITQNGTGNFNFDMGSSGSLFVIKSSGLVGSWVWNPALATQSFGVAGSVTGALALNGATAGSFTDTIPASITSWTNKWPAAVGTTGSYETGAVSGTTRTEQFVRGARSIDESGATCNGSTDDASAVNTWLSGLSPGATVYIPSGCELLINSANLTVPAGVTLRGAGSPLSSAVASSLSAPSTVILNPAYSIILNNQSQLHDLLIIPSGMIANPTAAQAITAVAAWQTATSVGVTANTDGEVLEDLLIEGFGTGIKAAAGRFATQNIWLDDNVGLDVSGAGDNTYVDTTRCEPLYALNTTASTGSWARPGVCFYLHDGNTGFYLTHGFSFMYANGIIMDNVGTTFVDHSGFEWQSSIDNGYFAQDGIRWAYHNAGVQISHTYSSGYNLGVSVEGLGEAILDHLLINSQGTAGVYAAGQSAAPTIITVAGTPAAGNTASITVTQAGAAWSPLTLTYTAVAGDTTTSVSKALEKLVMLNPNLQQDLLYAAIPTAGQLGLYWPQTITPTITVATTGGGVTLATSSGTAQPGTYGLISDLDASTVSNVPAITFGDSLSTTNTWSVNGIFASAQQLYSGWLSEPNASEHQQIRLSGIPWHTQTAAAVCGTGGTTSGTDATGIVNLGTGTVTTCNFTFTVPYPSTPTVTVGMNTTAVTAAVTAVSTTGFAAAFSGNAAGDQMTYQARVP